MSATPAIIVWLIEDNESYRRNAAAAIDEAEGLCCPETFRSCEEALRKVAGGGTPDVVLLDVGLPGMSGLEGIGHFAEKTSATNVIILTVFEDEDKIFEAICNGAAGYLLKTATLAEIVQAIREVRNGGAPINPRVAGRILGFFKTAKSAKNDYHLTPRETEILQQLVEGLIKKEIADRLGISFHTVDMHLRNIYAKLQVNTATGAVAKAVRERIV
jgi:DNA-binding NarL/FixJ family response regulator